QEDFDRIKARDMEGLIQARKSGPTLASRAVGSILQVPGSPLAFPGGGLPDTLSGLTLDDVKAFYAANLPMSLQGVVVSSSLTQQQTMEAIAALGALPVESRERTPLAGIE